MLAGVLLRRLGVPTSLLVALLTLVASATPAQAARPDPMARWPGGLQAGVYSPSGQAADERGRGGFGLRTMYVTGGLGHWDPAYVGAWLDETAAQGMVPVVTYYQLNPSARGGASERGKIASALRDRRLMPAYWRDVRRAMQVLGRDPGRLAVLHVEPDGWEFMDQLGGLRLRAIVGASGLRELRGLPNTVRGFAKAFNRLRDRYAPDVALAFHASHWGMGQLGVPSQENSTHVGTLRGRFVRGLRADFDLALTDPGGPSWGATSFAEHLAFVRALHATSGLPVMLFQLPTDGRVAWLLGAGTAAVEHLQAERDAGVIGVLWDAGTPEDPSAGRETLFTRAGVMTKAGLLGALTG